MLMNEAQPSLTVFRRVGGVERKHIRLLRNYLRESGDSSYEAIRGTVTRPPKLRANLLMRDELRNFYDSQSLTVSRPTAVRLGKFIQAGLSQFVDPHEQVPLLPATIHPPERDSYRKFLMAAHSHNLIVQRAVAKNAVRAFFGIGPDAVSESVWFEDDFVTGVPLAQSSNADQLKVVTELDELLRADGQTITEAGILPPLVQLRQASIQQHS
jgi:hypothetical protein